METIINLKKPKVICKEPMAKQSFKEECDINTIMRRYQTKGQLPDMINENPQYGDFSKPFDYQEALNTVLHAEAQFQALSAEVRAKFNNDPATMLSFIESGKNNKELVELGLAVEIKQQDPIQEITIPIKE